MPIFEVTDKEILPVEETTFNFAGLHERRDLQRLLRDHIEVIAPETLLIFEEFDEWEDAKRRIDLLAVRPLQAELESSRHAVPYVIALCLNG